MATKYDPRNDGPGSGMPKGVLSVTVPGAAWGWGEVLDKYGTMKFKQVLEPAAAYAEKGFPISERIANDWHLGVAINGANPGQLENCCTDLDPDSVKTWYMDGKQPKAGDIYRNPTWPRPSASWKPGAATASTRAKWRAPWSPRCASWAAP